LVPIRIGLSVPTSNHLAAGERIREIWVYYVFHKENFEMRGLNLDQLAAFADVIERGSFSAAAQHLNLTQPAISLQIKQLEQRLGVRLVERVGRRATPTAAGSDLLAHIRRIDGAVAGAMAAMAFHASGVVGHVRLATGATPCIYLLPAVLRDLRKRFPSLEITVSTGNTPQILNLLEENAIDIAFVTRPAAGRIPKRVFQATPVVEDEIVAIFPSGDARIPASLTPAAVAGLPLVLDEPGAASRAIVDGWFARAGVMPKPATELGNVEAIKKLVGAGLGCGLLPRMAVVGNEKRDGLQMRSLSPRLMRKIGVVLRRDKPLQRGLRELVNALLTIGAKER
jgi:DNA-binding transcriptional LysR family regulator